MVWTRENELTLADCRKVIDRCNARRITPAAHFALVVRMYTALKDAGLIEREGGEPEDLCKGCVEEVGGGCRRGYQTASLSLDGSKVVKCMIRRERGISA